jgi:hypothetical protein
MRKAPNFGTIPTVKAYYGALPAGASGIEFTTTLPHDSRYSSPVQANWLYPHTPGVKITQMNGVDYAWIEATIVRSAP